MPGTIFSLFRDKFFFEAAPRRYGTDPLNLRWSDRALGESPDIP